MTECEHEWQRAPDKDRVQGPMLDGRVGRAWLVFWCPKCSAVATQMADFDEVAKSSARPALRLEGAA